MTERPQLPPRDRDREVSYGAANGSVPWDGYEHQLTLLPKLRTRSLPCACLGSIVVLYRGRQPGATDIEAAVQLHQETAHHTRWRRQRGLA